MAGSTCRNNLRCAIQTFVLHLDSRNILVATCIGEHKERPEIPAWNERSGTGWLDRLRAAGVAPETVDLRAELSWENSPQGAGT